MSPKPSTERHFGEAHSPEKPEWAKSAREVRRQKHSDVAVSRRRPLWPWGIVVVLVLALAVVILMPVSAPPAATAAVNAGPVASGAILLHPADVTTIRRQTLGRTLAVSGTLRPARRVDIASRTTGLVEQVHASLGDRVSRGDLLAQIDDDALNAVLRQRRAAAAASQAEADLANAQAERARQLSNRGLAAAAAIESQTSRQGVQAANLDVQQAAVAAAEIALRDARVLAPFDGIIARRLVEPGQTVASGSALFELVDLSSMLAEVEVPVTQSVVLERGQQVRLRVEGLPMTDRTGRIEGVAPIAGEDSRNSTVTVRIDNADGSLRGGMYVSGDILTGTAKAAIAIPQTALREDAAGSFVLKLAAGQDGTRLVRQSVRTWTSPLAGGLIAIDSGLDEADRIVSGRLPELREGMSIRVAEPG